MKLVFLLVEINMVVSTEEYGELKESLAPLFFVLLRRSLQVLHLTKRLFFSSSSFHCDFFLSHLIFVQYKFVVVWSFDLRHLFGLGIRVNWDLTLEKAIMQIFNLVSKFIYQVGHLYQIKVSDLLLRLFPPHLISACGYSIKNVNIFFIIWYKFSSWEW